MAGNEEQRDSAAMSSAGEPGPLSRLLQEIFEAPSEDLLEGWKKEFQPGDRVGRFEIRLEVGRGGFGAVYEAFDTELNRVVAVKTLRLSRPRRDLSSDWIKQEAEAVARLDHPCIVTLFDVGTSDSGPYLVMELLRGKTLSRRIAEGPIPTAEALRIAEEMAKGLAHAHQRGVLHRDLKPANVFLCEDGRVKLLDFGLAHLLGTEGVSGAGTPAYMAPEQARGEEVDQRADVYAAGRVLGEMVGAKRPRPLERAIAQATSTDRAARPRDGQAWMGLLQTARHAVDRPARMRRIGLFASAFLLLGTLVAGVASWRLWRTHLLTDADGRITVAVADFANQTGDPELDGLSGLLITSLEQSKRLRVLTRSRMWDHLRAMGKDQVQRIDEPLARDIGNRAGARALLLASVRRMDDVYSVEMRAFDPKQDEYLFTVKDRAAGKKGLLDLIDRLSERTRNELRVEGAEVPDSGSRTGDAVTVNLEAYQHYFTAQQLSDQGKNAASVAEFRKALEKDSRFSLAHYGLSVGLWRSSGSQSDRLAHADAAALDADRLPERESLRVRGWQAWSHRQFQEARGLYGRLVAKYPDDRHGLQMAGILAGLTGDSAGALPYLERALQLDPTSVQTRRRMMEELLQGSSWDQVTAFAREWVADAPTPEAHCALARVSHLRGDAQELAVHLPLCESGEPVAVANLATAFRVHLARYDPVAARKTLERIRRLDGDRADEFAANLAAFRGRMREAKRLSQALEESGRGPPGGGLFRIGLLSGEGHSPALLDAVARFRAHRDTYDSALAYFMAVAGEFDQARDLAHNRCFPENWCVDLANALEQRSTGILDEARTGLERLATSPLRGIRSAASYSLGETCHMQGDSRCAVRALEEYRGSNLNHPGGGDAWSWPRSLLWSALAWERLGENEKARAEVDRLLGLWVDADPDIKELLQARALRARLTATAR